MLNTSVLKVALEKALGIDEIKEANFMVYSEAQDTYASDSDSMNAAKRAISEKASQLASAIEAFVKSGDVTVIVPTGTFSQGASTAATPNPSPVPLQNGKMT